MIYYRGRWLIEPEIKALLTKLEDLNKDFQKKKLNALQRLQNNLLVSGAAVFLKLTKMNTVSDNAVITKQSIIAYALIVRLEQTRATILS